MSEYAPPVSEFVEFELPDFSDDWPNYVEGFGLNASHVPDLIRMVSDRDLYDSPEPKLACASIHARRALGQLGAADAVAPLLEAMQNQLDDDDYWLEELAEILEMIGPPAIPALIRTLANREYDKYVRGLCARTLGLIGKSSPESRGTCVAALAAQLELREDSEKCWYVNAVLVNALRDLNARETLPVIEKAYEADVVDESVIGGLATIKYEMGVGPEPRVHDIRPMADEPTEPRDGRLAPSSRSRESSQEGQSEENLKTEANAIGDFPLMRWARSREPGPRAIASGSWGAA